MPGYNNEEFDDDTDVTDTEVWFWVTVDVVCEITDCDAKDWVEFGVCRSWEIGDTEVDYINGDGLLSDVDGRVATFVVLVEVDSTFVAVAFVVVVGWVGSWAIGLIETAGPRDVHVHVDVDVDVDVDADVDVDVGVDVEFKLVLLETVAVLTVVLFVVVVAAGFVLGAIVVFWLGVAFIVEYVIDYDVALEAIV